MSTNMLIFAGRGGNPHLVGLFRAAHPELVVDAAADIDEAQAKIGDADIFLSWSLRRDIFGGAKRLKWLHSLGTGVDGLADAPSLAPDVIVTATRGIHGGPMSEAAFLFMLALARKFTKSIHLQEQRRWERFAPSLLRGKTVGILGSGAIAREFAPRCKAFGMNVVGFSGTVREIPGFDAVHRREELAALAGTLDFLVLLAPLDNGTRGLVGENVLSAMKPTSFLVNLARGAIIDDAALVAALNEGRIGGAGLDTFVEEPLPQDHPFWKTPNVLITNHLGGYCDESDANVVAQFSGNLRHFLSGAVEQMTYRHPRG